MSDAESITDNQTAGVDESGIVKICGASSSFCGAAVTRNRKPAFAILLTADRARSKILRDIGIE